MSIPSFSNCLHSEPGADSIFRRALHLHLSAILLMLAFFQSGVVSAESLKFDSGNRQVTLLELYTSQGCSSCPPAENWLNKYVSNGDLWTRIVPIAFHVDYWDYIGWKDIYAAPQHGQRQREYAQIGQTRTVYTPGFFSNGKEWRGWTRHRKPPSSDVKPGNLSAEIENDRITVSFPVHDTHYEVNVALLGFELSTKIERGENHDRTLEQEFIVLAHQSKISENGSWELEMPKSNIQAARYGVAVWISKPGNPTPIQVTGGWLSDSINL